MAAVRDLDRGRDPRPARLCAGPGLLAGADAGGHQAVPLPRPGSVDQRRAVDVRRPPVRRLGPPPGHRLPLAAGTRGSRWAPPPACRTGSPTACGSARCCSPPAPACCGAAAASGSASAPPSPPPASTSSRPYVLPYVSRTSAMLLPWAGLGWIVGLTVLAATRTKWRHAALCALVVASVGAVNATALLMVAPAPVLWLLVATLERRVGWIRAMTTAVRIGVLSLVVSLWWIAAVVIQGRRGAEVLAYSESLESVSFTSTSTEVWRGLGYWLTYISDPFAATTTAATDHMTSGRLIARRLRPPRHRLARRRADPLAGAAVRHRADRHRRRARRRRAPARRSVPADERAGRRRRDRTGPGVALEHPRRPDADARPGPRRRRAGGCARVVPPRRAGSRCDRSPWPASALLALVNLPSILGHRLVDPALDRDQDVPAAWVEAAAALDELPAGYRVLQIPGVEFGAFRWGYTVDPPLPGLTERPLVTRDLLPLGSPGSDGPAVRPRRPAAVRHGRRRVRSPRSPGCSASTRSGLTGRRRLRALPQPPPRGPQRPLRRRPPGWASPRPSAIPCPTSPSRPLVDEVTRVRSARR